MGSDPRFGAPDRGLYYGISARSTGGPVGYGVIGNTADSGSAILGSSPSTPAVSRSAVTPASRRSSGRYRSGSIDERSTDPSQCSIESGPVV